MSDVVVDMVLDDEKRCGRGVAEFAGGENPGRRLGCLTSWRYIFYAFLS